MLTGMKHCPYNRVGQVSGIKVQMMLLSVIFQIGIPPLILLLEAGPSLFHF